MTSFEDFAKEHGFVSGGECRFDRGQVRIWEWNNNGCLEIDLIDGLGGELISIGHLKDPLKALRRLWRAMTPKQRRECGLLPKTVELIRAKKKPQRETSEDLERRGLGMIANFVAQKGYPWCLRAISGNGLELRTTINGALPPTFICEAKMGDMSYSSSFQETPELAVQFVKSQIAIDMAKHCTKEISK